MSRNRIQSPRAAATDRVDGLRLAALVGGATPALGNVALSPTCTEVTLSDFRPSALPLADLTIASDAGVHRSGPYAGPGWTIAVPATARGAVRASASDGFTTWTSAACVIPAPAPPPAPRAPDATPTAPPRPSTIEPPIRVTPPKRRAKPPRPSTRRPRPPARTAGPAVWCRWLNTVGAGPKRYRDRGLTFRCRIVKRYQRPPAVTG
ncbi:hypothetical protein [Miltoncostaea marina]|uniref:hypothetical protein n=1 Tax=Miltoncostaea marina TaxID=2843215 RepID=UPI001C3CB9BB|nr:hypothetical protein [Miltoncostaea marina]